MSKLFQNGTFCIGCWIGLVLFGLINIFTFEDSLYGKTSNFSHGGVFKLGFPFTFFIFTPNSGASAFIIWTGLIADILISIVFSFVIGLIFKFIGEKIAAKKLK